MPHPLDGAILTVPLPDDKLVAILKFREGFPVPQNPAVLFQVTLDSQKISPSGRLIRFGNHQGDEVVGWQLRECLQVVEVIGRLAEDGKTVEIWRDDDAEPKAA